MSQRATPEDIPSPSTSLYAPLVGVSDIRILQIEPAADLDAPFALSLQTVGLHNQPKYDALSYTWADEEGDDARTVPVEIRAGSSQLEVRLREDGSGSSSPCEHTIHQAFITKNCNSALRRLRSTDRPRFVWIDALCINQEDVAERTHQVLLMSRIFLVAKHVAVYTGEATPLTDRLFDTLNDLPEDEISVSSPFTAIMKQVMHGKNATAQTSRPEQLPLSHSAVNQLLSSDNVAELATTYFSRRWFMRVWVLQEVALPDPRRIRILCGAKTTTAMRALLVMPLMTHHLPEMVSRSLGIFLLVRQNVQVLPFPSLSLPGTTKMRCSPLLDILITTRDRQAQDPRDRIFGVLSLANGLSPAVRIEQGRLLPSLPEKLQADYALSTAQVFTRYSEFFILTHGAGFFLALLRPRLKEEAVVSHDDGGDETMANLPSWAANWSSESRWLNDYALRGFDLACSTREKLEGNDVWFRDTNRGRGSQRAMVLQGRRRIKRGWFSRHVCDAGGTRLDETTCVIEGMTDLNMMDLSLILLEMYPGVAALLSKLQVAEEDGEVYEFKQVCAHAKSRGEVAEMVHRWSEVVVTGGTKHDEIADYLDAPQTFIVW
ncbi:hypothetical protein PG984_005104 [Apiospora sp. TS-2023a]